VIHPGPAEQQSSALPSSGRLVLVTAQSLANDSLLPRLLSPYGLRTIVHRPTDRDLSRIPGAEVVALVVGSEAIDDDFLNGFPGVELIVRAGSGVDNIRLSPRTAMRITIKRLPGVNADAVADHAFGMMLSVGRRIPECDAALRQGVWSPLHGTDLWSKTLGLVGFGTIGKAMVNRARGFSMRVLAYARHPEATCYPDVNFMPLTDILEAADYVSLHLPLTPDTRHILGHRELGLMRPSAYLINTARGELVDESALIVALSEGKLAGAALDVFHREPLADARLLTMRNIVLTAHQAGYGDTTAEHLPNRTARALVEHWRLAPSASLTSSRSD